VAPVPGYESAPAGAKRETITQLPIHVVPDPRRVVIRPFEPSEIDPPSGRADRVAGRVLGLDRDALALELAQVVSDLATRHPDVDRVLLERFDAVNGSIIARCTPSVDQARLIGAYFSEEYSFEAGAVLNPSIVVHPDQTHVAAGALRFILSLRCIGEGGVSSVTFRTGIWTAEGAIALDAPSPLALSPRIASLPTGEPDDGHIRLTFDRDRDLSEVVIFPITTEQRHGIEDLRLIRFIEDDGQASYRGTYVAFSGIGIRQELLRTDDFTTFDLNPLTGDAADNKGMALFPRKVNGRYAALARKDHENLWFVQSDTMDHWSGGQIAIAPRWPWEFVQLGNCGAPIEIAEGWLVITHGVGAVRNYCLGACLLDKEDPGKLLARTTAPLLRPAGAERDGYVPNVIYSCGSLLRDRTLLMPYAVADSFTAFATVNVDELLKTMA